MTLLAPRSVRADDVFGTVKLDGAVVRGGTLEVRRERSPDGVIEVTIGQNGGYRIFLEPGRYTVRLKAREPSAPEIVNSMPAPIRLDLNFRRTP